MAIDKTDLQVLANYCAAAAESMAYTVMRTAHSTFVKETEDFSCGLLTPEGLTFASPKGLGATWYIGLDYGPVIGMIDGYKEGDICLTNDPYSGYVCTHSPDIHVWKPVFWQGELVCFVGGHIHNTDVGGAVPATLSRTLTEVQQEGLRIPPIKIFTDGKFDENILKIMRINVRVPEQNWGDLNAQIASLNTGERKVHEIIGRFGLATFRDAMVELLDYAEQQARAIVRQIPDGEYFFADYADEDAPNGYPCRIALTLKVHGDTLTLDWTGSDPQLASSLNMPTGGRENHVLTTVGLTYVLYTLDPNLVLNAGAMRVARCILPEGTIMNPVAPAAVGMRSLTCNITQQVTIGAFSLALPEKMPGSPAGGLSIMNVKTTDRRGRSIMASIGPVGGGAGGMPHADGSEGAGANTSFLKNTPVEINEAEVPIKILEYGLSPDSGGAGKWRGGNGTVMEFQLFAPHSMVTARNRDRSNFDCWGVRGGGAGANSRFTKNPGTAKAVELANTDIVPCDPGDVIRIVGAGAGGWGHPHDRPANSVLKDVRCGFVSAAKARAVYGVAIEGGAVDEATTKTLRDALRGPASNQHFSLGAYRERFEHVWNRERYDALTRILAGAPVVWRYFIKHRIFESVLAANGADDGSVDLVEAAWRQVVAEYPEIAASEA